MRSPRGFRAAIVLLAGVALTLPAAIVFGGGAENVIRLAFGASFVLLAFAVFDFELPAWINVAACAAAGVLAMIFLLQGAGDLLHSDPLRRLAYDFLGQRLEKVVGYVFLLWCAAVVSIVSAGKTRILGALVLGAILGVESYGFGMTMTGREVPGALKLSYLPLFVWLVLESTMPRRPPV